MGTKLINLSELSSVLQEKEKTGNSVLNFSKQFKLSHILRSLSHIKQQGYSLLCLISSLVLVRLSGLSLFAHLNTYQVGIDENTFYRIMNDVRIDWRKILMGFAWQFVCIVKKETVESSGAVRCFVVDDTLMEKAGKTFSGISKVYDACKAGFRIWIQDAPVRLF